MYTPHMSFAQFYKFIKANCYIAILIPYIQISFYMPHNRGQLHHFFHYYKGYTGTFYPKNQYNSGKVLIKQVETFKDSVRRLKIAKSIVLGIGKNIYEALYHYYRHGKSDLKPFLDWIHQDFSEAVKTANSIPEIMAYEGNLWEGFYRSLVYFLPEDFILNKRVKRPPDNPMNALISFGNMLLYTKMISAIYRTHLDQRISFLHDPSERRFSLSLDLSEAFKPVIVYRTIFELVNRKRLKVEKHFDKKVNYCLLNEEGRDIFIEAFEARLQSVFTHKKLKRKIRVIWHHIQAVNQMRDSTVIGIII